MKVRLSAAKCCGKASYATREVAESRLRSIAATAAEPHPVRAYRCDYGWWHLTSKPPRDREVS